MLTITDGVDSANWFERLRFDFDAEVCGLLVLLYRDLVLDLLG